MPAIGHSTLPQEFFDRTSAMLLVQPEPQYLHAKLWFMALNAAFEMGGGMGLPGREIPDAGAPYQTDPELGRLQLSDGLYDESIMVVPELSKGPGETIRLNRPAFTNSTYTQAVRQIPSGTTISTTPIAAASEQVPITIRRFGGPYLSGVQPYGIERFDALRMVHNAKQIAGLNIKRDFDRTIDSFLVALYDAAANVVYPSGITQDDDMMVAGDSPMTYRVIAQTEKALDDAHVPTFSNGRRAMVLHTNQTLQLSQDSQFNRLSEFHKDFNPLFAGSYWRTCGNFDIFKSTTLSTSTNGNSVTVYNGQAFGPGAVGCGLGEMPRVATSTADNYGETALLIWLLYAGFAGLDNRFLASIRTD